MTEFQSLRASRAISDRALIVFRYSIFKSLPSQPRNGLFDITSIVENRNNSSHRNA